MNIIPLDEIPKDPATRPIEFYQSEIVGVYSLRMGWVRGGWDFSTLCMSEREAALLQMLIDMQAKLASEGVKATAEQVFDTIGEMFRQHGTTMFYKEEIAAAIRSRVAKENGNGDGN